MTPCSPGGRPVAMLVRAAAVVDGATVRMNPPAIEHVRAYLARAAQLEARYRKGEIHVHVPAGLAATDQPLDEVIGKVFPASKAALDAASRALFYSLPVAFDPGEAIGPYLATADRDEKGEPYRFLDMGALIATHAFGENGAWTERAAGVTANRQTRPL